MGNLDIDFKIRISDLQSNAKSENGFQRLDICLWIFIFTVRLGNPKKDCKTILVNSGLLFAKYACACKTAVLKDSFKEIHEIRIWIS